VSVSSPLLPYDSARWSSTAPRVPTQTTHSPQRPQRHNSYLPPRQVDVARSLFNLLPDATPEHLALRQSELKRVITGVVASHPDVHYYQGLHDVAGVLVLVLGEHAAYVHLDRLVQHHLRDCTRYTHAPASHLSLARFGCPAARDAGDGSCVVHRV